MISYPKKIKNRTGFVLFLKKHRQYMVSCSNLMDWGCITWLHARKHHTNLACVSVLPSWTLVYCTIIVLFTIRAGVLYRVAQPSVLNPMKRFLLHIDTEEGEWEFFVVYGTLYQKLQKIPISIVTFKKNARLDIMTSKCPNIILAFYSIHTVLCVEYSSRQCSIIRTYIIIVLLVGLF